NTVKNIRAELEETKNAYEDVISEKKAKSRTHSLRIPDFITKLQRRSRSTPASPPQSWPKKWELGRLPSGSISVIPSRYRFYKRHKGQILAEKEAAEQDEAPVHPGTIWFFSDEKNLTQEQKHNPQYNRDQFQAAVLMFGIIRARKCQIKRGP
ncbi:Uncharacterized protein FKW44_008157, partial [Caligus rogercresseyi]